MLTDSRSRLQAKLLAQPDELTDLRIIFAEYTNVRSRLDNARASSYPYPPMPHRFNTFEERQAYLEAVKTAQRWRAHVAALQETCDSLAAQLRMMAGDLPLETLDALLQELGEVSNAPV